MCFWPGHDGRIWKKGEGMVAVLGRGVGGWGGVGGGGLFVCTIAPFFSSYLFMPFLKILKVVKHNTNALIFFFLSFIAE